MKVVAPFLNKGYNITADNWFTNSSLAQRLAIKNTTIIGSLRNNSRDVPGYAKDISQRVKKSSVYYKSNDQLLLSFWDKGPKPVVLLSTIHTFGLNEANGLPEMVSYYNSTRSGVDNMDHMVRFFSSKRKCFR